MDNLSTNKFLVELINIGHELVKALDRINTTLDKELFKIAWHLGGDELI